MTYTSNLLSEFNLLDLFWRNKTIEDYIDRHEDTTEQNKVLLYDIYYGNSNKRIKKNTNLIKNLFDSCKTIRKYSMLAFQNLKKAELRQNKSSVLEYFDHEHNEDYDFALKNIKNFIGEDEDSSNYGAFISPNKRSLVCYNCCTISIANKYQNKWDIRRSIIEPRVIENAEFPMKKIVEQINDLIKKNKNLKDFDVDISTDDDPHDICYYIQIYYTAHDLSINY